MVTKTDGETTPQNSARDGVGNHGELWGSMGKYGELWGSSKIYENTEHHSSKLKTRARASVCMRQARFALAKRVQMLNGERQKHLGVGKRSDCTLYTLLFESYICY